MPSPSPVHPPPFPAPPVCPGAVQSLQQPEYTYELMLTTALWLAMQGGSGVEESEGMQVCALLLMLLVVVLLLHCAAHNPA